MKRLILLAALWLAGCSPQVDRSPSMEPTAFSLATVTEELTATATLEKTTEPTQEATVSPDFHLPGDADGVEWLAHHRGRVESLAFSPDGCILAVGFGSGDVVLRDMATGTELHVLPHPDATGGGVADLDFNPDSTLLAVTEAYIGRVALWDVASGEQLRTLEAEGYPGHALMEVEFSPDGSLLTASVSSGQHPEPDGRTFVWRTAGWERLYVLEDAGPPVAFTPDSGQLYAVSGISLVAWDLDKEPGPIIRWDLATGTPTGEILVDGFVVYQTLSPDGTMLAANVIKMGATSFTLLLDPEIGAILHTLPLPSGSEHSAPDRLGFSPNGALLAVGYQPNRVVIWDTETGTAVRDIIGPADWLGRPTFSPDGINLAASSSDERILFWEIPSGPAAEPVMPAKTGTPTSMPDATATLRPPESSSLLDLLAAGLVTVESITIKEFPDGWMIEWILANPTSNEQQLVIPCGLLLEPIGTAARLIVTRTYQTVLPAQASTQVSPFMLVYDTSLGQPPGGTIYRVGEIADDWQNWCSH